MSDWLTLAECPKALHKSQMFPLINNTELVVLSSQGVNKYNVNANKWSETISYANVNRFISRERATFDELNQLIYVYPYCSPQLLEYDLNSKIPKILTAVCYNVTGNNIICINGIIHLIGKKHFTFDKNTKSFNEIHQFNINHPQFLSNIIYLKSKKTMILFDRKNSEMHEFQTCNNKWNKYKCKAMPRFVLSSIVCTKNEKYLVVLGGYSTVRYRDSISIFIFNLKNKTFIKSAIKCPFNFKESCYIATIMRDDIGDDLMVFGYVNQCFASSDFENIQPLPFYIIKLIGRWVCNEWIHLIEQDASGKHWKIHIDSIINSIQ